MNVIARTLIVMLAASPLVSCYADETMPTAESIVKQIMGSWELDEGVNQGRELTDDELEGVTVVVDKRFMTTYDKDKNERYKASYKIDASKNPIQINMTTKMEGMPPSKSLGILKIEDDGEEWELCYALPGEDRPSKFKSAKGSKVMLFEMEREDD